MPEGPEIHMAARFINQVANKHEFGGTIVKSEVSTKNPDVVFDAKKYRISAESRGKELKVYLEDVKAKKNKTHILFRFGMSGCYKFTEVDDLPKHAHLRFFTVGEKPVRVLSFVDYRRFGRWEIEGDWGKARGPDPMFDYGNFRKNVLDNLEAAAFNKPICETMLDQKYFNGIGNYLRAEILFRLKIKPFTKSRDVLEPLRIKDEDDKSRVKNPDILDLCHSVPKEVLTLDKGKNYDPDAEQSDKTFSSWLQCYYVEGMNNLQDGNGRTMWFEGEPGPMVPKNAKVVGRKGGTGSKVPKSGSNTDRENGSKKKTAVKTRRNSSSKDVVKEEPVAKEEPSVKPKRGKVKEEKKSSKRKVKKEEPEIKEESVPAKTRRSKRVTK